MDDWDDLFKDTEELGKTVKETRDLQREFWKVYLPLQDHFLQYPSIFTALDLPARPILNDFNGTRWQPDIDCTQMAYKEVREKGRKNLFIGDDGGQNVIRAMNHKLPQIFGGHCLHFFSSNSEPFFKIERTIKSYPVTQYGIEIPYLRFLQESESKYCLIRTANNDAPLCNDCRIKHHKCKLYKFRTEIPTLNFKKFYAFMDMPLVPSWITRYHDSKIKVKFIEQVQRLYDYAVKNQIPLIGITHGGPGRDWALSLSRFLFPNNHWEKLTKREHSDLFTSIRNIIQQFIQKNPKLANILSSNELLALKKLQELLIDFDIVNNDLDLQILDHHLWGLKYIRKTGERTPAFNIIRNEFIQENFGIEKYGHSPFGMFFLGWSRSYQRFYSPELFPEFIRVSFLLPKNGAYSIEDIHKATFVQLVLGEGHPLVLKYSHQKAAPEQIVRKYLQLRFEKAAGFGGRTFKDYFKQFSRRR